jgi:hypothetical protein
VDLPNPISSGINVTDGERFIPPATGDEKMEKIPAVSKRTTFDFSKLAEPERASMSHH